MREFFDRLNMRIAEFMEGRYGLDNLNKFLLIFGFILVFFGAIVSPVDLLGWGFAIIALFRALSRNFDRRQIENEWYLKITRAPKRFFKKISTRWKNRKTTVYFKCSNCKQPLSVPKGKGKIRVICPKCGTEIYKTT